ncbi:lipopolysaccharide biosynthesis protein [Nocardiopsis alborubida]|uniref:Lipopolysaccharide biosynthesis protein n=1 Tax=Nocardiopsis alborubida TaxID=146802 RepID=A0A7X6MGI1_9ACTN|nr:lipopolysaccharide biosynthesis protein [Nocardiopsis alborubida]NKZ00323.1 lipopolysaccharide biosynthesis protein [Nocardiopsis alborubida]
MDTDASGPSGPELREYTALLRRRRRFVGAGVLGGLALAAAAVVGLPAAYTSVSAVQVQPSGMAEFTGERSGRLAGDVNLDTEAQVLLSDRVSSAAAESLGEGGGAAPSVEDLRERVDVSVPPNSSVLEISYSAGSPEAARAGAQAYADAYLELRRERIAGLIDSHLEALRGEQEARYEALAEAAGESADPGTDARVEALRAEITELGNGISPLSALAETVEAGRVITPAGLPERASSPLPALWLVGGAALGLLAGLLAAVVRDRLDPRLHDAEETGRIGTVPVLLDLSERVGRGQRSPGLLSDGDRRGQRVNELAHLVRARLAPGPVPAAADQPPEGAGLTGTGSGGTGVIDRAGRAAGAGGAERGGGLAELLEGEEAVLGRVLLVTATTPGRAGAATAVNLAASLARTGSETLLVCADPRADTVGELLGLPEGPGLAEALLEGEDPAGLEVRPDVLPRLRVLRYGSPGLDAPVQGTAMPELVRLLRAGAEYVVVAVAPVSERADAHALAGSADLMLPVVELGRTRRTELRGLLVLADRFGVPLPGTAVLPRQPLAGPAPLASPSAAGVDGEEGLAGAGRAPGRDEAAEKTVTDEEGAATGKAEGPAGTAKGRAGAGITLTGIVSELPAAAGTTGAEVRGGTARPPAPREAEGVPGVPGPRRAEAAEDPAEPSDDVESPLDGGIPAGLEVPRVLGGDGATQVPVSPEGAEGSPASETTGTGRAAEDTAAPGTVGADPAGTDGADRTDGSGETSAAAVPDTASEAEMAFGLARTAEAQESHAPEATVSGAEATEALVAFAAEETEDSRTSGATEDPASPDTAPGTRN